jgi:hypothetical protein
MGVGGLGRDHPEDVDEGKLVAAYSVKRVDHSRRLP